MTTSVTTSVATSVTTSVTTAYEHKAHKEVCHECALEVDIPKLNEDEKALCPRCGYTLSRCHKDALNRILAFSITSLIFLIYSLPFDFMTFSSKGLEQNMSILSSFSTLLDNNYKTLIILELMTIYAIPITILTSLIYLLFHLKNNQYPNHGHKIMNMIYMLIPWSMVEIFLVASLVSLVKMNSMAQVSLGPSFYSFLIFTFMMTATLLHMDKHQLYQLLNLSFRLKQELKTKNSTQADKQSILIPPIHHGITHQDPSLSIQQTWALIIASIIFYIPANFLPIMTTSSFGNETSNTIIGGIIVLWKMGSIPIALVVFFVSILVPVSKIIMLSWLNYSVQQRSHSLTEKRTQVYRLADFIGRWSMVDVFVVIILVSLIQLGNKINVYPGLAILAFTAVVILTMLAAMTFNPKLIWTKQANKI